MIQTNSFFRLTRLILTLSIVCGGCLTPAWSQISLPPALNKVERATQHPHRILVKYRPQANRKMRKEMRDGIAAPLVHEYTIVPGLESVEAGDVDRALRAFRANPLVEYAEPDYVIYATGIPNDPDFTQSWGLNNNGLNGDAMDADIDAPEAWDIFSGSPNFVIAVMDTGVQWTHPDLVDNIWTNPNEIPGNLLDDDHNGYIDDIHGWDFVDRDNNPDDPLGHGTHVAGTLGARGNNGIGSSGVARRCRIMPLRIIGPFGGFTSDALRAMEYATAMGVRVSNNSWGTTGNSQALYNAIQASQSIDHLYIAAAGNDAVDNDLAPTYPASFNLDNVIAVAATTSQDTLASFSNWGASSVDIAAPGDNIFSTLPGDAYGLMSGTSMATPHVTGTVALITASHPEWSYIQIRNHLLLNTDPKPALQGMVASGGRLNVNRALSFTSPQRPVADIRGPRMVTDFNDDGLVTITLDGSDSFDLDGTVNSYRWTDGASLLESTTAITLTLPVGSHVITLTVTDDSRQSDTDIAFITVLPSPPPPLARDDFESGDSLGGIGRWIGGWNLNNETLVTNRENALSGSYHLRIHGKNNTFRRFADLYGATQVHLQFWLKGSNFTWTDHALVTVKPLGAPPIIVQRFGLSTSDNVYRFFDIDLSDYLMTESFEVEFSTNLIRGTIYLDNVELVGNPLIQVPLLPQARAGIDQNLIDANNDGMATVTLDGSASFDPDGVIVSYAWFEGTTLLGTQPTLPLDLALGNYNFSLTVTDDSGMEATDSINITVSPMPIVAADDFESDNFAGGTGLWIGDWNRNGDVKMRTNRDGPHSGQSHVRLKKRNSSLSRIVDLSGVSNPHLRFWGKAQFFTGSDFIEVRISTDGNNFTTLLTLTTADSDDIYHPYDLDLTGLPLSGTFQIEFISDFGNGKFLVDDIEIVLPQG